MGSSSSALNSEIPGADLRLPTSGLKFTVQQLRTLNSYVDSLHEEDQRGRLSTEMESAVENLVQRIVDGAGQRDPRFRCCHLIALHRGKKMRSRSLEYLVTLDSLPTLNAGNDDCCLQDGPVGYGKIRLSGREADKWAEFITPSGYLCRDKVLERWVELIARCANARGGGGSRVACARAASHGHPYHYCYLERASHPQSSPDRRLAIVEGAAWVMVRVGAGEAEAKLVLGARVAGCNAASYTIRLPLTHPMALLHYASAQGGYYAAAVGPPSGVMCGERNSTWQLWTPSLEAALDAHSSDVSPVSRVAGALNALLDHMRDGTYNGCLRAVSRYMCACALRRRLLRCAQLATPAARGFVSAHASHHLLLILDDLLHVCECGGGEEGQRGGAVAGFVFPAGRGAVARRGARGEWRSDAEVVRAALQHLHTLPLAEDVSLSSSECLESTLFNRWDSLNRESKAATATTPTYTRRQLMYLWRVSTELIKCKNMVVCENGTSVFRANLIQVTSENQEAIEDLIHIMAIMLDQARDQYLKNVYFSTLGDFDKEMSTYRSKKWTKLKDYYDASAALLIDAVRRDPDLRKEDLEEPLNIIRHILNWLYKGSKDDKKYLGPVLKPYLDGLFNVSLENCWFLEDFDCKLATTELDSLREYCDGVHDGKIEPCMGLLDAAKKSAWAKAMVDLVDRFKHIDFRIVFPTGDGMAISYPIKLPSRREHSSARILTLSRRDKAEAKLRLARRCVLGAFTAALVGGRSSKQKALPRHSSTDEILASVKTGSYWRNSTKPDIIPSTSTQETAGATDLPRIRRRSRRSRASTSYGFPEISITDQTDTKTMRRKYHTLKSLVYTEPVESIKELRERPRSAGSTVRNKEALSRPSILETLDFINGVKDALCVEESGLSEAEDSAWSLQDEWLVGQTAPLNLLAARSGGHTLHLMLGDLVLALLYRGRFTILQELCSWLGASSEGALFALYRLARAARSRSSDRASNSWKLPEAEGVCSEPLQRYRLRPPDYVSGDESSAPPAPPPLPRTSSSRRGGLVHAPKHYSDYLPPDRLQLEQRLNKLGLAQTVLDNTQTNYTGVINPLYDVKIPRDKFSVKRSKSLGRTFSARRVGLEITRYNLTLGYKSGKRTNDVVTAINGMSGETGLELKSNFFQRYSNANVVGDAYRVSRATID